MFPNLFLHPRCLSWTPDSHSKCSLDISIWMPIGIFKPYMSRMALPIFLIGPAPTQIPVPLTAFPSRQLNFYSCLSHKLAVIFDSSHSLTTHRKSCWLFLLNTQNLTTSNCHGCHLVWSEPPSPVAWMTAITPYWCPWLAPPRVNSQPAARIC